MTLRSVLEDVRETTVASVVGLLGKLRYLASLRRGSQQYRHWGMGLVHGEDASNRALRTAHGEVVRRVLRAPLSTLMDDLQDSSGGAGIPPGAYVEQIVQERDQMLPARSDAASLSHFNAVMMALSSLLQAQGPSNPSVAWPCPPLDPQLPHPGDGGAPGPAPATEDAAAE